MDEVIIQDLKQFISAELHQQTSTIKDEIYDVKSDIRGLKSDIKELKSDIKRVENKVDDITEAVAEALDSTNTDNQKQFDNHNVRITRLEQKAV